MMKHNPYQLSHKSVVDGGLHGRQRVNILPVDPLSMNQLRDKILVILEMKEPLPVPIRRLRGETAVERVRHLFVVRVFEWHLEGEF